MDGDTDMDGDTGHEGDTDMKSSRPTPATPASPRPVPGTSLALGLGPSSVALLAASPGDRRER